MRTQASSKMSRMLLDITSHFRDVGLLGKSRKCASRRSVVTQSASRQRFLILMPTSGANNNCN